MVRYVDRSMFHVLELMQRLPPTLKRKYEPVKTSFRACYQHLITCRVSGHKQFYMSDSLDNAQPNIMICHRRRDRLFADDEGRRE